MARATNAVARKRRKKKVLKEAKGYFGRKHSSYRLANEQVMRSGAYAYRDRRTRKRDFRRLWIIRINAAAREHGLTYGQFISGLKEAGVTLDRKSLSELAIASPAAFATLARQAKSSAKPVAKPAAKPVAKPAAKAARA